MVEVNQHPVNLKKKLDALKPQLESSAQRLATKRAAGVLAQSVRNEQEKGEASVKTKGEAPGKRKAKEERETAKAADEADKRQRLEGGAAWPLLPSALETGGARMDRRR